MKTVIITFLAGIGLYAQTAVFPSGVVTDSQLKVALNNSQSTLNVNISSSTTSFAVGNCSPFVPNQLVTIDIEVMSVSSCTGTTMVVSARPFPDSGNVAVAHLSGALINGYIDSWHHNALRVEIEAIESALGSGLANVVANTAIISPTFGGTGINNGGKTITLGGNLVTSGSFNLTMVVPATGSWTLPAAGTLVGSADTGTVTNTMLAGSIASTKVTGTAVTQADTATVTNTMLAGSIAASKLVGTDIATLGTITTGTWHGTLLGSTYGGTGVNNGSNTLTLAGNVVFAGAFNPTFSIPSSSTWTFPAAGTLIGSADTGTVTNTMLAGSITNAKLSSPVTVTNCGSSASCGTPATLSNYKVALGTITFSSSTTATITGISPTFTATADFVCTVTDPSHTYTWTISNQSSSSFTITAGTSNSDTWSWNCGGF